MSRRAALLVLVGCIVPYALQGAPIIIPATSNIFGAGHASPPAPPAVIKTDLGEPGNNPGRGSGTLPVSMSITPSPFWVLHVNSVSGYSGAEYGARGGVKYNGGAYSPFGGDGTAAPSDVRVSSVSSMAGISGVNKVGRILFLVGVFLGDAEPTVAPKAMDMNDAENQVNFTPEIGQTFYIGLGTTKSGTLQNFYAPKNATRVYFGFADAWFFHGEPSWYNDNLGALVMNASIDNVPTPEPASVAFVALPLLAFAAYRRIRA